MLREFGMHERYVRLRRRPDLLPRFGDLRRPHVGPQQLRKLWECLRCRSELSERHVQRVSELYRHRLLLAGEYQRQLLLGSVASWLSQHDIVLQGIGLL
jgi:hypothetical protein